MKDKARLRLAIHWVQTLVSDCEGNYPLRPVKTGRQSLKWTSELESLRRGVRRLFNKCQTVWKSIETQQRYRKEVGKASKVT